MKSVNQARIRLNPLLYIIKFYVFVVCFMFSKAERLKRNVKCFIALKFFLTGSILKMSCPGIVTKKKIFCRLVKETKLTQIIMGSKITH